SSPFLCNDPAPPEIYTLSLHDALPILIDEAFGPGRNAPMVAFVDVAEVAEQERMPAIQEILTDFQTTDGVVNAQVVAMTDNMDRSEEHTSELQSRFDLVCRLLLEKKNK